MNLPSHGSNPHYLYEALQIPMPNETIDFSVNVNPFGAPKRISEKWMTWLDNIEDYPDPFGERLTTRISEAENIPMQSILLGNGGAEIIHLLANMFQKKRVLLIQPTFSEYERMCRAYDCHMTYCTLTEGTWDIPLDKLEKQVKQHDVVFLCHPNNPTGITYTEDFLLDIIKMCQKNDCYIIFDEAFYDFMSEPLTVASYVKTFDKLIVIRSMTKMYAIAGLRLGYAFAHEQVVHTLRKLQTHWSVNALALLAGEESMKSEQYVTDTRNYFTHERNRIIPLLVQAGYTVSKSEVNYYLLRDPDQPEQLPLFTYLLRKGLVPRHTVNYPGLNGRWLRFAIRTNKENDHLVEALVAWKKSN